MPELIEMLKKQFVSEIKVNEKDRTLVAIISTISIDRDNEIILPQGADLKAYKKNPVVLWAHEYHGTPIGRALWIKRSADSITAKMQFAETEKAEEIYQLFKGGFLKAFSIGFLPADGGWHSPTAEELKNNPKWASVRRVYDKWELLEFSAVPVPANPEALVAAVNSKTLTLSEDTQEELHLEKMDNVVEFCDVTEQTQEPEPEAKVKVHGVTKVKEIKQVSPVKILIPVTSVTVTYDMDFKEMTETAYKRARGIMY